MSCIPRTLLSTLLAVVAIALHGQPHLGNPLDTGFIRQEHNVIYNRETLEPFFDKLFRIKSGDSIAVNVVHIGDSHIQADFLTEVVRKGLQREFGNAGRGLIVPGRVAGTNEPLSFISSSTGTWEAKRIIHPSRPIPIGIGGITITTGQDGSSLAIRMKEPEYAFNNVSIFMQNDVKSFKLLLEDSLANEIHHFYVRESLNLHSMNVQFPVSYTKLVLKGIRERPEQTHATIYGLNLQNGRPGVLYHAIGVNGAQYEHYNKADYFVEQTPLLNPDLFIISLGTNESVGFPNIKSDIPKQIDQLVNALRAKNAKAAFVLVTPPDSFLKKTRHNPGIELVRTAILQYAVENGFAFWDMHLVGGGTGSAHHWRQGGLLRPDGIHFTRDGYALQGNLLLEAIMKSYRNYAADRPQ